MRLASTIAIAGLIAPSTALGARSRGCSAASAVTKKPTGPQINHGPVGCLQLRHIELVQSADQLIDERRDGTLPERVVRGRLERIAERRMDDR